MDEGFTKSIAGLEGSTFCLHGAECGYITGPYRSDDIFTIRFQVGFFDREEVVRHGEGARCRERYILSLVERLHVFDGFDIFYDIEL